MGIACLSDLPGEIDHKTSAPGAESAPHARAQDARCRYVSVCLSRSVSSVVWPI